MNVASLSVNYNQSIVQKRNYMINYQKKNINFGDAKTKMGEAAFEKTCIAGAALMSSLLIASANSRKSVVLKNFPADKMMAELTDDEAKQLISMCFPDDEFAQKFMLECRNSAKAENKPPQNTVQDFINATVTMDTKKDLQHIQEEFREIGTKLGADENYVLDMSTQKPSQITIKNLKKAPYFQAILK